MLENVIKYPHPLHNAPSRPLTGHEINLRRFSATIREKPRWTEKVTNRKLMAKWFREAALQDQQHVASDQIVVLWDTDDLEYMHNELIERYKPYVEKLRESGSCIEPHIDAVWKADGLIEEELRQELINAVATLEHIPNSQKDWHPGSNGQVFNLVHPSLWPIIYDRTLSTNGESIQCPKKSTVFYDPGTDGWSTRFCWLPSEFKVSRDGKTKITSYINNLSKPEEKRLFYPIIERIFDRFVPMFSHLLSDLAEGNDQLYRTDLATEFSLDRTDREGVVSIPISIYKLKWKEILEQYERGEELSPGFQSYFKMTQQRRRQDQKPTLIGEETKYKVGYWGPEIDHSNYKDYENDDDDTISDDDYCPSDDGSQEIEYQLAPDEGEVVEEDELEHEELGELELEELENELDNLKAEAIIAEEESKKKLQETQLILEERARKMQEELQKWKQYVQEERWKSDEAEAETVETEGYESIDEDEDHEGKLSSTDGSGLDVELDEYRGFKRAEIWDIGQLQPDSKWSPPTITQETTLNGKTAKVIVKMANIILSPQNPTYGGGMWHVEAMKNERIIATGIYYYDQKNITDSSLCFRRTAYNSGAESIHHSNWGMLHNMGHNGVQVLGEIRTKKNRALVFPNIYQHCVSPFELKDRTKRGYRKILVFFLCDPNHEIPTTKTVAPQQLDQQDLEILRRGTLGKLPEELFNSVLKELPPPITVTEARQYRFSLIKERSTFTDTSAHVQGEYYNFCEH
ncbi:hypothetical protein TWF730_010148 [Orbilia blumenaviensis]|uniref:Uncharacterized protein n=1 Tax=Orbilia blumenaviensis TaxID=1796055 RepID=A0AAV9UQY8_9PEZI